VSADAGKSNFCQLVAKARSQFGRVTAKVSGYRSSHYSDREGYSVLVFYSRDGNLKFRYPGQSWGPSQFFHISISKVSEWPAGSVHDRAGQGMIHDYHHKMFTGEDFRRTNICAAGGSVRSGTIKHSSIWINAKGATGCSTDGNKMMSAPEQAFVNEIVQHWARAGAGSTYTFSDSFMRSHCPGWF
jgi:hypothetical protein